MIRRHELPSWIAYAIAGLMLMLLAGCDRAPSDEDMAGCTTSNRRITQRDVAECAIERAERRR